MFEWEKLNIISEKYNTELNLTLSSESFVLESPKLDFNSILIQDLTNDSTISLYEIDILINDQIKYTITPELYAIKTFITLENQLFNFGQNDLELLIYIIEKGEKILVTSYYKQMDKSFYDFLISKNGQLQRYKVNLYETLLASRDTIFIGATQNNIEQFLSNYELIINVNMDSSFTLHPIYEEWNTSLGLPEDNLINKNLSLTLNLQKGNNTISIKPLIRGNQKIYGLALYPLIDSPIKTSFTQAKEIYYKFYILEPEIIKIDEVKIDWSKSKLPKAENFKSIEIFRDNICIKTVTDINVTSFIDRSIESTKQYFYQVRVNLIVPPKVYWDFNSAAKDLWNITNEELVTFDNKLSFNSLPLNVSFDNDKSSIPFTLTNNDVGIFITDPSGNNLFKQHIANYHFNYEDRIKLKSIITELNIDNELITFTKELTKFKTTENGAIWKLKLDLTTLALLS